MSKQRQGDRHYAMAGLSEWACRNGIEFSLELATQIDDGFGVSKSGEDPFDALAGILSMIEVLGGRWPEGWPEKNNADLWEGWILGQAA